MRKINLTAWRNSAIMNKQLVFDTAVKGIRQQGKRSIEKEGCVYRSPDGCKCAVGHLIPDENYDSELENFTPVDRCVRKAIAPEFGVTDVDADFLRELQVCHDAAVDFADFSVRQISILNNKTPEKQEEAVEKAFEAFAKKYRLTYVKEPWNRC